MSNNLLPYPAAGGSAAQMAALRDLSKAVELTNQMVLRAVNAGASVEIVRVARCHDGCGHWGDQMVFAIRSQDEIFERRQ